MVFSGAVHRRFYGQAGRSLDDRPDQSPPGWGAPKFLRGPGCRECLLEPAEAPELKAEFLKALQSKGETAGEMAAFTEALLAHSIDPEIDRGRLAGPLLDICGTGGDRLELFNISTAGMFVLAAGGAAVVKHGNRAITSRCGGADVLEALGVPIELPPAALRRCVESLSLGFIFAPAYHPAFRVIAPVRRQLAAEGVTTIFNFLGPLLNPARPERQLVGVYQRGALPRYAETLAALGGRRHGRCMAAAWTNFRLSARATLREATPEGMRTFLIDPAELGIPAATLDELRGGDCHTNALTLEAISAAPKRVPSGYRRPQCGRGVCCCGVSRPISAPAGSWRWNEIESWRCPAEAPRLAGIQAVNLKMRTASGYPCSR